MTSLRTLNQTWRIHNFGLVSNIITAFFLLRCINKLYYNISKYGIFGSIKRIYYSIGLGILSIKYPKTKTRGNVDKQILARLEEKLIQRDPNSKGYLTLPKEGWSVIEVNDELEKLHAMDHTRWEDGRVSGTVYHGGDDLLSLQTEAIGKFSVSNPIHPDVFPGVRKMEAEIVAMVLALFNGPSGGVGVTTAGGTESILMACLAARDKASVERGVTNPEMIIPETAHAAFYKAAKYFNIKLHEVSCPAPDYKVDILSVRRLINRNTVLLVGSAPNFPHGIVDDIPSLSNLAVKNKIPLHVDCCLGSFVVAFLKQAGFPSPYEDEGGFDFRQPGVTSISVDTHKYGFAPKGNSVLLYRDRSFRNYQYFILPNWSGGAYASPSMAGSRPGALIAGCWASLMAIGESGYIATCRQIVGAAKNLERAILNDPILCGNLCIIGHPMVSVVAFASKNGQIDTYDIADTMSAKGWHLNALQSPPAIHCAFTKPSAESVDVLVSDLRDAVANELHKIEERKIKGGINSRQPGDTSALYGIGGSISGNVVLSQFAEGFLDTLYKT
ncbi:putative sphinganine-1-phosphate aldolase BST1 [Talaromyces proteolyticus]|uniref:sphinganine-1-phosphate aldolase n=1 Tax=Talaromyces proteolyticus TaxID=1131652 RepID=A0AAD4KQL0_9EURO|nr:putative sphinganine-1-phosphate aldolase BST1 [Talaromyces proteolyticus]KAH8693914.1 putative sphinganine-1-phosphate aldolase BST1 [Talaromyces proteolyticus]